MTSIRASLTLLLCVLTASAHAAAKPKAVWFYADWCMNCKMIAPKLAVVQPEFEDKIDFIKLDVTNEERKAVTREQAKKLGILPLYMGNKATGWLALLNANGKQVGELRHFMSEDEMRTALTALVPAAEPAAATPQAGLSVTQ